VNPSFVPGLELSRLYYEQTVRPILARHVPGLVYCAALIGPGSEVLGFDTPQSTDHDWGPRLQLFVGTEQARDEALEARLDAILQRELPRTFRGYPCFYTRNEDGTASPTNEGSGQPFHRVVFTTVRAFFRSTLNWDVGTGRTPEPPTVVDWLAMPEQVLRSVTGGAVYHDGLGQLKAARAQLRYYPHDLWLYLLANQWMRISQEEHFMGRCGQVGDDLGSRLVAARLVRDLMRLCFLMERRYAPYIKWLGTAFQQLECGPDLAPVLHQALLAETWQQRETHLTAAYEHVARQHNALGLTARLEPRVSPFYGRPFLVLFAERFAEALHAQIEDPEIVALPKYLGGIDQFVDSTDVLSSPQKANRVKTIFQP
jgi:hypothetical protein